MPGKDLRYIVDASLTAQPIYALLSQRAGAVSSDAATAGPALPVSPDGKLEAYKLYDASDDPAVKYYLPRYQLRVADGQFTTRLKLRGPEGDPEGPVGYLTIELEPDVPPSEGFALREIAHEAVVQLTYRLPLEEGETDETAPPAAGASEVDGFAGRWVNVDENTGGMTRLIIEKDSATTATFHGFGKCHPDDCDWGKTAAQLRAEELTGTYDFGFKKTHIRVRRSGQQLTAEVADKYAPGDGRPDRQTTYVLRKDPPPGQGEEPGPGEQARLSLEVGALERTENGVRRCVMPVLSLEEYDRLYQVMTTETYRAAIRVRCLATVGHRTWRQIFLGGTYLTTQQALLHQNVLITDALSPKTIEAVRQAPMKQGAKRVHLASDEAEAAGRSDPRLLLSALVLPGLAASNVAPTSAPESSARELASSVRSIPHGGMLRGAPMGPVTGPAVGVPQPATGTAVEAPGVSMPDMTAALARAFAAPLTETIRSSDLSISKASSQTAVVPQQALVDQSGQPALLHIEAETVQVLRPFTFPPATHAYMFDVPDAAGGQEAPTTHALVKRTVMREGTVAGTFYQDAAFRDQFYFQPQEFRLSRLPESPYLPDLIAAFYDVVSEEGDQDVAVHYRVVLGFRAVPYIDPSLFDLARVQLAEPDQKPFFTALEPGSTRLFLRLPREADDGRFETDTTERTEAIVDFNTGIREEIDLSQVEFEHLFSAFQAPSGIGVEGYVEAGAGEHTVKVPVHLSLDRTVGSVFDCTFDGPLAEGPDHYGVSLHNRIESPVHLMHLRTVEMPGGAEARPLNPSPDVDVAPGGTLQLAYEVTPAGTTVSDLEPALEADVRTDHSVVWRALFQNKGYSTDTFTVTVSIDPAFFGTPPSGMEPLTEVVVAFEGDTSVRLTPSEPATQVRLRMPLLQRLLKEPAAQQYRYQVTNVHASGPGARTPGWIDHEGDLQVTPVANPMGA